ncbi:hypothetical protein KUTeg_011541 [Tegillarca granosa]|uniref:Uncharacterized protein n=1 Tax=Tegillarca granosa TaxID=220873 RepID=A0ABQ9EZD5_TEGGR|nr:hypothetical protein KUTeg_011541 [Tegillarca granosa]
MDAVNINKMQRPELRPRGITVGDYRLEQLRELAEKAAQMDLPVIEPNDLNISMEKRSTIRIDDVTVQHPVVYDQSLGNWTDDLNEIPIITAVDIFAHLMSNAGWEKKRVNQYKEERGYKLFRNRHIYGVQRHRLEHQHLYVRGLCIRETSQTEKPYLVWCLLSSYVYNLVKDYETQIIEVLDTDCHLTPEPCIVPDLALLYKTSHNNLSYLDFVKSSLGNEECTVITNQTEGQSENMLWYRYRMGRVTASSPYSVVKYSGTDPNNY